MIEESLATTARRGAAYEGFYRSTRPFARLAVGSFTIISSSDGTGTEG